MVLEQPTDDTYIFSGADGNNYNMYDFFCHGYYEGTRDGYFYTLVMWDIYALPPDITINSATMKLYCEDSEGTPNGTPRYYIVTENWDESTVTWGNKPDYDTIVQTSSSWPNPGTWHNVDVTEFVENWYNGTYTNYGIYGVTVSTSSHYFAIYRSKEHTGTGYDPKLEVEFTYNDIANISIGKIKSLFE
jgi:hypothetical protein